MSSTFFDEAEFKRWKKRNPDLVEAYESQRCQECKGFGQVECGECGRLHECPSCHGEGSPLTSVFINQHNHDLVLMDKWRA